MIGLLIAYMLGRASKPCSAERQPAERSAIDKDLGDFLGALFSLPGIVAVVVALILGIFVMPWLAREIIGATGGTVR